MQHTDNTSEVFYHRGGVLNGWNRDAGWYFWVNSKKGRWLRGVQSSMRQEVGYKTQRLAELARQRFIVHDTWQRIWADALGNMPYRIGLTPGPYKNWFPLPKGVTPVGDVIKGLAKGTIRKGEDGFEEFANRYVMGTFGQQYCLTRLMRYKATRGAYKKQGKKIKVIAHNTVYNNWRRGSVPKEKWRQRLLKRLAQDDGRQVAAKLLKQQGFDLDHYNYVY